MTRTHPPADTHVYCAQHATPRRHHKHERHALVGFCLQLSSQVLDLVASLSCSLQCIQQRPPLACSQVFQMLLHTLFLGLGIGEGRGERLNALLFLRQACGIVHVLMHGVLVALRSHIIHRHRHRHGHKHTQTTCERVACH